jgi:hypothetical protein
MDNRILKPKVFTILRFTAVRWSEERLLWKTLGGADSFD